MQKKNRFRFVVVNLYHVPRHFELMPYLMVCMPARCVKTNVKFFNWLPYHKTSQSKIVTEPRAQLYAPLFRYILQLINIRHVSINIIGSHYKLMLMPLVLILYLICFLIKKRFTD